MPDNNKTSLNLLPPQDVSSDLGSATKRFKTLYAKNIIADNINNFVQSSELNRYLNTDLGGTITGDVDIIGNLNIIGTRTEIDTADLKVKDNLIIVNNGEEGAGVSSLLAGIKVDRGTEPDYYIMFDETEDMFKVGLEDDLEVIASHNWVDNIFLSKAEASNNYVTKEYLNQEFNNIETILNNIIGE